MARVNTVLAVALLWILGTGTPFGCRPGGAAALCPGTIKGVQGTPGPSPASPVAGDTQSGSAVTPSAGEPAISFILPRSVPFRMDFSVAPESPSLVELSPVTFGEATQTRLRGLLRAEMAKYPSGTLGAVNEVFIGGTLRYNGRPVGGFQFVGLVFITAGEADAMTATDTHVVRAFHHEVSHALLDAHGAAFDAARFRASLPPGFVYREELPAVGGGGRVDKEAQPDQGEDTPTLDLLAEGFLIPWAQDGMHEDFSSYAEILLRKPDLLLKTFAPDSRVGRKARVVRDFYIAIDPRFAAILEPDRSPPAQPSPDR